MRSFAKYFNLKSMALILNTLRPRQDGRHFPDDIFKCIFLNENVQISIKISMTFAPKGPTNNTPALVRMMTWRRRSDKPLSEPMVASLLTHICVTRPQWVNSLHNNCIPQYRVSENKSDDWSVHYVTYILELLNNVRQLKLYQLVRFKQHSSVNVIAHMEKEHYSECIIYKHNNAFWISCDFIVIAFTKT